MLTEEDFDQFNEAFSVGHGACLNRNGQIFRRHSAVNRAIIMMIIIIIIIIMTRPNIYKLIISKRSSVVAVG